MHDSSLINKKFLVNFHGSSNENPLTSGLSAALFSEGENEKFRITSDPDAVPEIIGLIFYPEEISGYPPISQSSLENFSGIIFRDLDASLQLFIDLRIHYPQLKIFLEVANNETAIENAKLAFAIGFHGLYFSIIDKDGFDRVRSIIDRTNPESKIASDHDLKMIHAYRQNIDAIDSEIINLLHLRADLVRKIFEVKTENGMPILQPDRYKEILQFGEEEAAGDELDPAIADEILRLIHLESVREQIRLYRQKLKA